MIYKSVIYKRGCGPLQTGLSIQMGPGSGVRYVGLRCATAVSSHKSDELESVYTMEDVTNILVKVGGTSRLTLFIKK